MGAPTVDLIGRVLRHRPPDSAKDLLTSNRRGNTHRILPRVLIFMYLYIFIYIFYYFTCNF